MKNGRQQSKVTFHKRFKNERGKENDERGRGKQEIGKEEFKGVRDTTEDESRMRRKEDMTKVR